MEGATAGLRVGVSDISKEIAVERASARKELGLIRRTFGIVFNQAPVMMHAVDKDGRIVKVNRRWLQKLGYKKAEVLGRKITDFLTEASRARAVKDVLPLFWRAGSDRSVGMQFLRKNGRVLDVLIDAEVCPVTACDFAAYAAVRDGNDTAQWEQSSITMNALQELMRAQHKLDVVLTAAESDHLDVHTSAVRPSSGQGLQAELAHEVVGALLESVRDISATLRGQLRVQEESLSATTEQQRELLLLVKGIDKTLVDLTDAVAEVAGAESKTAVIAAR